MNALRPGGIKIAPFYLVSGVILIFGAVIVALRYAYGLAYATNLTQTTTWGLWTGFKLVFVALAASGFTLTTGVYIFGMHEYHPLVRPAVLSGFVGYSLFILILLFDLGRSWRIFYPFLVQAGVTSALFEIALCVLLYYTTQFLELTPVGFEWLGWRRWRKVMVGATVGLSIFGLLLSALHQSTLGALYLTVPGKLHPLWYSPYLPLHFFLSSVMGGISMVMLLGWASKKAFGNKMELSWQELDRLTVGLGKAGAISTAVYLAVKALDISLGGKWHEVSSGWGAWYLLETLGCVLFPCMVFAYSHHHRKPGLIRLAAAWTVFGVVLNRLNVAVVAFNWTFPTNERYFPSWMEWVVVVFLIVLGLVIYRLVCERFAIVNQHPDYLSH